MGTVAAATLLTATRAFAASPGAGVEQSLNLAWVLVAGFLVMFMQVGFAMLETGFTRAKNAVNTMAMNLVIYPVGLLGFFLTGYGLMLGGVSRYASLGSATIAHRELTIHLGGMSFGLLGLSKFGLFSVAGDPGSLAMFMFAVVFMDTAATIATGALAERWKFSAFFIYGLFMSMLLYPLYGNWVWGGGWLSQLGINFGLGHGHVDFAGSSVVHMTGGVTALAGTPGVGTAHRQIPPQPGNRCDARTQSADGHGRHPDPGLRMVRFQLRLHPGRFRFPDRADRGQHDALQRGGSDRRTDGDVVCATSGPTSALPVTACSEDWSQSPGLALRVAVVGAIDWSGRRIDHGLERNHARAPSACGRPGWRDRGARSLRIVGGARPRDFRRR